MKISNQALQNLRQEVGGLLKAGEELVVAGPVMRRETGRRTKAQDEILSGYFSRSFLDRCMDLPLMDRAAFEETLELEEKRRLSHKGGETFLYGAAEEIRKLAGSGQEDQILRRLAEASGADLVYPLGRGGILAGLWKAAEASGVGLEIDLLKVPILQETVEICEQLDLNPYEADSEGSILIGTSAGMELAWAYRRLGIPAERIGTANASKDRLLYIGSTVRYLPKYREKEDV